MHVRVCVCEYTYICVSDCVFVVAIPSLSSFAFLLSIMCFPVACHRSRKLCSVVLLSSSFSVFFTQVSSGTPRSLLSLRYIPFSAACPWALDSWHSHWGAWSFCIHSYMSVSGEVSLQNAAYYFFLFFATWLTLSVPYLDSTLGQCLSPVFVARPVFPDVFLGKHALHQDHPGVWWSLHANCPSHPFIHSLCHVGVSDSWCSSRPQQ